MINRLIIVLLTLSIAGCEGITRENVLVEFLKQVEGFRSEAYQDEGGVWTVGYGRTGNVDADTTTTMAEAEVWLHARATAELEAIDDYEFNHNYEWNDQMKIALASFRFNGGQSMLDQLTDNGRRHDKLILEKWPLYINVNGHPSAGLSNRRALELSIITWSHSDE